MKAQQKPKVNLITSYSLILNLELSLLKSLPNGDVICNDFANWDLVLLDRNFDEKKRLPGTNQGVPDYYRLIKTRSSDDNTHLLHLRGPSELSLVHLPTFTARHIHNFFNFKQEQSLCTALTMDSEGKKIAGLGFIPGSRGHQFGGFDYVQSQSKELQTVHVFDGGDGVSIFEADEIHQDIEAWICLECSVEGDVFFIGAASKRDFVYGDAYIFALTFDEQAETVAFKKYGSHVGFHCINSLRRHPEGNILFAGCQNYLGVILWTDDDFFLITKIRNCVSNPITDICFSENTIYTVCDHNKGMALYFDDNLIRGRDERMRGPTTVVRKDFEKNMDISGISVDSPKRKSQTRSPTRATNQINSVSQPNPPNSSRQNKNSMTFSKLNQDVPSQFDGKFKNFKIKQISLPKIDLRRVQVSFDGRFVYCGKKELKVLEKMGDQYGMMKVGKHIEAFVDLKVMKNGNVIVFDEATSDLVKYDENLKLVRRLQGQSTINLSKHLSTRHLLTNQMAVKS